MAAISVSNRGKENNIAIFSIQADGTLKTIAYQPGEENTREYLQLILPENFFNYREYRKRKCCRI